MSALRWTQVPPEEFTAALACQGPLEHALEGGGIDGFTQTVFVGARPAAVGEDWGVSVVPERRTEGFSGGAIASRLPATTAFPRWTAMMGAIQVTLQRVSQTTRLRLFVPDLNVVSLVAKWQSGEQNGASVVGKSRGSLGQSLPGLSDGQLQADLLQLYNLCNARGNKLLVEQNPTFARLNVKRGEGVAGARLRAVSDSFVFFYPSHVHTDCFEVRFLDKTTGAARYERFFWWGEGEIVRYINLAADIGDIQRLDPARLAFEDPLIFWCICFHLKSLSSTLLRHTTGWSPLCEPLRQARARARTGVEACDGLFKLYYRWDSMAGEIAAHGGRGGQFHKGLAEEGYLRAIHLAIKWIEDCNLKQTIIEKDDEDSSDFMKSFDSALIADERGTGHAIETMETQMLDSLKIHDRVQIQGLKARPELNGCSGMVIGKDVKTRRAQVKIDDAVSTAATTGGRIVKIKATNLLHHHHRSCDPRPPSPRSCDLRPPSPARINSRSEEEGQASPRKFEIEGALVGQLRLCAHCGKKEDFPKHFRACSRCHTPRYCSKDCQVQDWKGLESSTCRPHKHRKGVSFAHKTICGKGLPALCAWAILLPADKTLRPFPIIVRAAGLFDGSDHPVRQDVGGRHMTTRVSEVNVSRAIDFLALDVFGMREECCMDFSQIRVEAVKRLPSHIHSNVIVVHRVTSPGNVAAGKANTNAAHAQLSECVQT
jgi:hypothetical protein